ncbi:hypothetical protein [Streptomyces sp. NPDC046821]|uniref:hypothetical protein n=1 Tax=Streptomyces sp. NPDC046821 TaxID=3154702 RepID=UPI0033CB8CD8
MVLRHSSAALGLFHTVFDGTTWTSSDEPMSQPNPQAGDPENPENPYHASRQGAAPASYGGKLHVVYPSAEGTTNLRHATWTKDGGWSEPEKLVGHESVNTPALLAFKDGPAGAERESLLLVYRSQAE